MESLADLCLQVPGVGALLGLPLGPVPVKRDVRCKMLLTLLDLGQVGCTPKGL